MFEKGARVGGISRTEDYKGYKIDIGGHRFFTKIEKVQQMWEEVLEEDLLFRPRLSRIYYKDKFFNYPIQLFNVLKNLGLVESARVLVSFLQSKLFPYKVEDNFEQWVSNRFGKRLYEMFFKTYTEKVWGIPCHEIKAEWAAQRIKGLNLWEVIKNTIPTPKKKVIVTLVNAFYYPKKGPGMLWERVSEKIALEGNPTKLNSEVIKVNLEDGIVKSLLVQDENGINEVHADHFISSMPLTELIAVMDPAPPQLVVDVAQKLTYRDFLTVALIVKEDNLFPDNWIYSHSPKVKVGRIQNYRNWSQYMVPEDKQDTSCIGLEYFCDVGDELWNMKDEALKELAKKELAELKLVKEESILDGKVIRQPKAYPVYTGAYKKYLEIIKDYLDTIPNLQTVGRNGLHMYNNQDHSMLTAMLAVDNIKNEKDPNNIWSVNTERSYHEEVRI